MSVMEKKMEEKPTENPILLLTMRYTKEIMNCIEKGQ